MSCEIPSITYPGSDTIICPVGHMIQVKSSVYGTPNFTADNICQQDRPAQNTGKCSAEIDLTFFAAEKCNGRSICLFRGSDGHAGDPCEDIEKYTSTSYECIKGIFNIIFVPVF